MKRIHITALLLLLFHAISQAQVLTPEKYAEQQSEKKQDYTVTGTVFGTDIFETRPYRLTRANVRMILMGDSTTIGGMATEEGGLFRINLTHRARLKDTRVKIRVSYVGMQPFEQIYDMEHKQENGLDKFTLSIDSIVMQADTLSMEEVQIMGELRKMYMSGDTLIFNTEAYEMPSGSVLLDLIRRLPGLQYKNNTLTYRDMPINEIKLNGDSFFSDDMTIALNNMPHDRLKRLKLYEEKDENDTITIGDRPNKLVMDMETKQPMSQVRFANANIGTTENLKNYVFGGDMNRWRKNKEEITASFNSGDIPNASMIREKNLITNGKATYKRTFGNIRVDSNVDHNYSHINDHTTYNNRTFLEDYTLIGESENRRTDISKSFNEGANISGYLGKDQHLFFRTSLRMYQSDTHNSGEFSGTTSNDVEGMVKETRSSSSSNNNRNGYNINGVVSYSFSGERKNTIGLDFKFNNTDAEYTSQSHSYSKLFLLNDSVVDVNHITYRPLNQGNSQVGLSYTRNLKRQTKIEFIYKHTTDYTKTSETFHDILADGTLHPVDSLNNGLKVDETSNIGTISFQYYTGETDLWIVLEGGAINRTLHNSIGINTFNLDQTKFMYNSSVRLSQKFKKNRLETSYSIRNELPYYTYVSELAEYSDPLNVFVGNSSLKPAIVQSASFNFSINTLMSFRVQYNTTSNDITIKSSRDRLTNAQLRTPVNINGNWNINESWYLTRNLHDVIFSLNLRHQYRHQVTLLQDMGSDEATRSTTKWHNLSANLNATYSDLHWITTGMIGYMADRSKSNYYTTGMKGNMIRGMADLTYVLDSHFQIGSKCQFTKRFGYDTAAANTFYCIWDLTVGYRFLKDRKGKLLFEWRDILNNQKGFNASMTASSWNESRTYGNTNLFVITFSYKLNGFK